MNDQVSHQAIVLDQSGSMHPVKAQTISGYNEQIQKLQATQDVDIRAWLTVFNHDVTHVHQGVSLDHLTPLTDATYTPDGLTAMYDAVGATILRMEKTGRKKKDRYLVVIISDGEENASKTWTGIQLAEKIQELTQRSNWTFAYIGANQDLSKVSEALNIPAGNTMSYVSTRAGTADAWRNSTTSSTVYTNSGQDATTKYFEDENA